MRTAETFLLTVLVIILLNILIPPLHTTDTQIVELPGCFFDHLNSTSRIFDDDDDGVADKIFTPGTRTAWVVHEYKRRFSATTETKIMPPEIQKAATEAMLADRKLARLIAKYSGEK